MAKVDVDGIVCVCVCVCVCDNLMVSDWCWVFVFNSFRMTGAVRGKVWGTRRMKVSDTGEGCVFEAVTACGVLLYAPSDTRCY